MPSEKEIDHLKVLLPPLNGSNIISYHLLETKTLIFDMDETLIHCVDDIETDEPDVIIPIQFPDEDEPVNVRLNFTYYYYRLE